MNKKEKGQKYESFVMDLCQTLSSSVENFENVVVERNKRVPGRSGCKHEIDIYWGFSFSGKTRRIAIECKSLKDGVSIGHIRNFHGALLDIEYLQGIFITLNRFQSGAKKYAEYYSIKTMEAREPDDNDWQNRFKTVTTTASETKRSITEIWANLAGKNTSKARIKIPFQENALDKSVLFDEQGNPIANIYNVCDFDPSNRGKTTKIFENAFVKLPNGKLLPVSSVTVHYNIENVQEIDKWTVNGSDVAKAIIKDVQTGQIMFFDHSDNVRLVDNKPFTIHKRPLF